MPPVIEFKKVSKYYGEFPALLDVDFQVEAGVIHAVMGENGAGKSTLMKVMAGVIQPEAGKVLIDSKEVSLTSPKDAERHGVVCMFQELSLAPHLSVLDNIVLGKPDTRLGFIKRSCYARAQAALREVGGSHLRGKAYVKDLTLAERQLVEMAKAIYRKPRILILDEATSAQTAETVDLVFSLIRALRDQGAAVLFISHRFHEVERLAETISVFRNGRHIETFKAGRYSPAETVRLMIGQSLREMFPPRISPVPEKAPEVLRAEKISWEGQLGPVDLTARAGEIIGLGGLEGQGQQTFLLAAFGLLKSLTGTFTIQGREVGRLTPSAAKKPFFGLALAPEDRKTEGLIQEMSILDNLSLASLSRAKWGLMGQGRESSKILKLIEDMGLVYRSLGDPVASLSGGNQQKVVLAKWLSLSPKCLLLLDPTRGIDVLAKSQIYRLLRALSEDGMAVILQSTDHEELINLCDRVHVFYRGAVRAVLEGAAITAEALISASMNLDSPEAAA
ncbi:MAG: sugar ABC transporter ATP-binding protein [Deltaproteobacteria bacterium]|jgi:ribose transport system ATP-binding protein|nr:sugar ABC transporter ATP-binding protein [Deltaproteobacteria bacterium]